MTRLSNRQFPMLGIFAHEKDDYRMSIEEAQAFDQRPFRSMLIQEWIVYKRGQGFAITKAGREAWYEFHQTDIARKNPHAPLTSYFDPTAYGLRAPAKKAHVAA
jgi:hypothetical protein